MPVLHNIKKKLRTSPPRIITLSFVLMIAVGTLLLSLPAASQNGQSAGFLNALFTATSANCVTGLVVLNTFAQWSFFGRAVILVLIQLGGLGLVTLLTFSMVLLGKSVGLENRILIQASFNQDNLGGMVRLVKFIALITLCFEGAGAVLLTVGFYFSGMQLTFGQAIGKGVFHSISAFCNAGFDVLGSSSLEAFAGNWFINVVIMILIIAGGLGFIVWADIFIKNETEIKTASKKQKFLCFRKWQFLSLHSKIAIFTTLILLFAGFALFLPLEWGNPATLGPLSIANKGLAAMFQSVTLRTAGFASINQGAMNDPSKLLSCIFMLIGASPASTGGGLKTVTFALIIIAVKSLLHGSDKLRAFGRTLPHDLLQKALTVAVLMLFVVFTSSFILFFTEHANASRFSISDIIFEVCSATGTVGLTTGITPFLSSAGKIIITLCMFLGRLSPLTVVVALNMRLIKNNDGIDFPHERVLIG